MNMFVFYLPFDLLGLRILLGLFVLGHVILCGYLLVIFGTCVCVT